MTKPPKPASEREELLPCPFCGNKAELLERKGEIYDICCGVAGCYAEYGVDWYITDKQEAINRWNTRPAPDTQKKLAESGREKHGNDAQVEPQTQENMTTPETEDVEGLFADILTKPTMTWKEVSELKAQITSLVSGLREEAKKWEQEYNDQFDYGGSLDAELVEKYQRIEQLEKELAEVKAVEYEERLSEPTLHSNYKQLCIERKNLKNSYDNIIIEFAKCRDELSEVRRKLDKIYKATQLSKVVLDSEPGDIPEFHRNIFTDIEKLSTPPEPSENPPSHKATGRQEGGGE